MKDYAIQKIRVWAMIFIVFYHCLCFYGIWDFEPSQKVAYHHIDVWRFCCTVALTAFVFISGFLFARIYQTGKYQDSYKLFSDKCNRLLIPYFLWGMVLVAIFPDHTSIKSLSTGIMHLWFLLMLFSIFCIIITCKKILFNIRFLTGGVITLIIINSLTTKFCYGIDNYLAWRSTLTYLPAFMSGILVVVLEIPRYVHKIKPGILYSIFGCLSVILAFIAVSPYLPLGTLYVNLFIYAWLILLYCILSQKKNIKTGAIMDSLDRHSMGIYIVHHIVIWFILVYSIDAVEFMKEHYIIAPVLLFFVVFSLSWVLTSLINSNDYTSKLFNTTFLKRTH